MAKAKETDSTSRTSSSLGATSMPTNSMSKELIKIMDEGIEKCKKSDGEIEKRKKKRRKSRFGA